MTYDCIKKIKYYEETPDDWYFKYSPVTATQIKNGDTIRSVIPGWQICYKDTIPLTIRLTIPFDSTVNWYDLGNGSFDYKWDSVSIDSFNWINIVLEDSIPNRDYKKQNKTIEAWD